MGNIVKFFATWTVSMAVAFLLMFAAQAFFRVDAHSFVQSNKFPEKIDSGVSLKFNNIVNRLTKDHNNAPVIYSDTAVSPHNYTSPEDCFSQIDKILISMETKYDFSVVSSKLNIGYIHVKGSSNNFVLRCFQIEDSFRIFIAASSHDKNSLNNYMKIVFYNLS